MVVRRIRSARGAAWVRIPPAVLLAVVALACQGRPGDDDLQRIRKLTYPPDFHYITQGEIRTTMDRLAVEVSALEAIMEKEGGPRPEDRPAVIAGLERMEHLAAELKKGPRSNHPRIGAEAPRLRADIERALISARTSSPNYYDVGRVVGACMYCHSPSDAPDDAVEDPDPGPIPDPSPDPYRSRNPNSYERAP